MTAAADTHYHKPITRRIYYNNCVVMVTNCGDCKEELSRWIIEGNDEQLNINTYLVNVTTTSCSRTAS
jgi:hypothetical protein